MSRLTLAQQLKQLEEEERPRTFDPEAAYTSLDSLEIGQRDGEEGREHYLDVGPSRLRAQRDENAATLLGDKYAGKSTGRMKIFDDDDDDDEEEEDNDEGGGIDGDDTRSEGDDAEESDEELDDEDEEDEEESDDEAQDEEDNEEDEEPEAAPKARAAPVTASKTRALDPLGSLREARQKDIEKGQGIRKQKALFDSLITLRITFQKALTASTSLAPPLPIDPSGGLERQRLAALRSLADLNEKLLELRTALVLPGTEVPELGKRKRGDEDEVDEEYLRSAAKDSLAIVDAQRPQLLGILNKWSSKINAASMAVTSKAAGSSKFLQGTKGQTGVVEAIEAGIAHRKESDKTFMESEEAGYRLLLKEVIESRGGGSGGADLTHLRREKKKKREAERGGSKGRKLRYTVHEKAQNYAVPIPLANGWNDDQMDELFSSLLGGAGMKGAGAEVAVTAATGMSMSNGEDGLAGLGGLRVF